MATPKSYQFKLVLLGDSSVGKSSLVLRFVKKQFFEYQESTIGAAFLTQTVAVNDFVVKFEIWDTAGQERYRAITHAYYKGAVGAIIVFDISKQESFQNVEKWMQEIKQGAAENTVVLLIGNKSDLDDQREVPTVQA